MTIPQPTASERQRADAWMRTEEFRQRVETAREKYHDAPPDFAVLADELDLPLAIVADVFARTLTRATGTPVRPAGRRQ